MFKDNKEKSFAILNAKRKAIQSNQDRNINLALQESDITHGLQMQTNVPKPKKKWCKFYANNGNNLWHYIDYDSLNDTVVDIASLFNFVNSQYPKYVNFNIVNVNGTDYTSINVYCPTNANAIRYTANGTQNVTQSQSSQFEIYYI